MPKFYTTNVNNVGSHTVSLNMYEMSA